MQDVITFEEAKKIMDGNGDFVLLDVREQEEYDTGHANGAQLLPVDLVTEKSAAEHIPNKNTAVLVYCRSGRRSRIAANSLRRLGYTAVYDIGSLVGWPYGLTRS